MNIDVIEVMMVVAACWMGYQLTDAIEFNKKENEDGND